MTAARAFAGGAQGGRVGRLDLNRAGVVAFVFAFACLMAGPSAVQGQEDSGGAPPKPPEIDASSWALVDADSGRLLAGKNVDDERAIASITKVMVALVTLDEGVDLDEDLEVSENAGSYAGFVYSNIGLYPYDKISVREALQGALIPSGTDAVYALAEYLGNGSSKAFVEKMNEKAKEMNLEHTRFENPAGLDSKENYSSARDVATITQAAMKYPFFRDTVASENATITTQDREIKVFNTNELLQLYPEATGVKTGTTPEAGASLVASAGSGEESYIAVILDSRDDLYRFGAAEDLLDYGFDTYSEDTLVPKDKTYDELSVPFRRDESRDLVSKGAVSGLVREGSTVERKVETGKTPPSAPAGEELGTLDVVVDGQSVGTTPLILKKGYEEASFWQKTWYRISGLWN